MASGELLSESQRILISEMREGLREVQGKAENLKTKVKDGEYQTKDGISYLDSKHLLLSSYCQHLVFLILLKSEGKCIADHPVVERLAEIRMFLEKIRPIDKKLQYQVDKLLKLATAPSSDQYLTTERDDLRYKPNPDMLVSKIDEDAQENGGVYKPPKIAPTTMDEELSARDRKLKQRAELRSHRQALRSAYIKDMADDLEGRPEEIRETYGNESKVLQREIRKLDQRAKQEEDMFARVPLSKVERKKLKQMKRSNRNGLAGLMEDFNDEVAGLVAPEDDSTEMSRPKSNFRSRGKKRSLGVKKTKNKFKRKKA